jgi:antagonist of KipI
MGLVVINPGLSTTIQDLGRTGYREWGVPVGGAFDRGAAAEANALVGNPPGCAVLELTLFGGVYEARAPLALALAGARLAASIAVDGEPARSLVVPQSFSLAPGERLTLGGVAVGARAYLAVKGGWRTPLVLGSRSREERLKPSDWLDAAPGSVPGRHPVAPIGQTPAGSPLRIIDGPDATLAIGLDAWAKARFRVSPHINRMGVRLEGPPLAVEAAADRISTPVAPGALQIAGGQVIILGVACGTMGGYPHVAHVISADLDRTGQLRPGDTLEFQRVSLHEARRVDREHRQAQAEHLRRLRLLACDALDL